jgi:hypothetical protein
MLDLPALTAERQTDLEPRGGLRRHTPTDGHDVAAHDRAGWIGERSRECRVGGEEQQARRRPIEASNGDETPTRVAENVEHSRTAVRIAARCHCAPRFVEGNDLTRQMGLPHDLGVIYRDANRGRHPRSGITHHAAVHADAASPNQADRLSP